MIPTVWIGINIVPFLVKHFPYFLAWVNSLNEC